MFIASARSAAWSLYRVQFIRVYVVEDRMSDARARAPCRRDVSPFASRDNELLCPVGRLLFGSRDVAMVIRETLLLSFFFFFFFRLCSSLQLGEGEYALRLRVSILHTQAFERRRLLLDVLRFNSKYPRELENVERAIRSRPLEFYFPYS